jgi:hypothetical protein
VTDRPAQPEDKAERDAREAAHDAVNKAIDWNQVLWPSSRRPLQQMRDHLIVVGGVRNEDDLGATFESLGNAERGLAYNAIENGLGHPNTSPEYDELERKVLTELYQEVGIAGPHEARQLVEQLEQWFIRETRRLAPGKSR